MEVGEVRKKGAKVVNRFEELKRKKRERNKEERKGRCKKATRN